MDEKIQDLSWACLPKEVRDEIKSIYTAHTKRQLVSSQDTLLDKLFGNHNLTSDTEPEEMLMVERKTITNIYAANERVADESQWTQSLKDKAIHVNGILETIFGDKCLPDDEKQNSPKHSNSFQIGKDEQPSVQVEPKFKYSIGDLVTYKGKIKKVISRDLDWSGAIMYTCSLLNGQSPLRFEEECLEPYIEPKFNVGDKVIHNHKNREVGEVVAYFPNEICCYSVRFGEEYHNMAEDQLLPYVEPTKPKFKVGDIVRVKYIPIYEGEIGIIDEIGSRIIEYHLKGNKTLKNDWFAESYLELYTEPSKVEPKFKVGDKVRVLGGLVQKDMEGKMAFVTRLPKGNCNQFVVTFENGLWTELPEKYLEPYTEPEIKDNMEEKELNLVELLKGCNKGEKFYSRCFGTLEFGKVGADNIIVFRDAIGAINIRRSNGKYCEDGEVDTYPSKELYEKYPLDAYSAWMEWKESRKPKRWIPKNGEGFWCISPSLKSHYYAESDPFFDWESDLNHFRTKELAQQAAEGVREYLLKFHEKNNEE